MPHLSADDVELHYAVDGRTDGAPIVLSNSLGSDLGMWDAQIPALTDAGWRVVRYDNRGHGKSGLGATPYSLARLADDAVALLDSLELDAVHFCGLSLGGMVGQHLAVAHPRRIRSLTLCDTAAYMGPPELWTERIEAVTKGGMEAVADGALARWFTEDGRIRLSEAVDRVRAGILATHPRGYVAACAAIRDMDQRESIRAIDVPTHVIVGQADPSTPVAAARLIHERIAGSRLTVIPEAAHLANIEQAEAFNAALLDFLERVR